MANRLLRAALVLGVAAAALEPFLFAGSFAGDAQVHLVFAESASHGRCFEFNPGERVSGETSPGYMLLEAVLFRVCSPRLVPVVVKVLNLAGWYLFCLVVYRVARRTLNEPREDDGRTWPAIAAVVAALVPGSVYNANVGMENGLFALLVWEWVDLAGRWRWFDSPTAVHRGRELSLGALLGVAAWLRPEAWLVAAVAFAFQLFIANRPARTLLLAGVSMVAVGAACIGFQYAYTGDVIATSILSRQILAMKQTFPIGPLRVDLTFAKRLIIYAPMTLFAAIGLLRRRDAIHPTVRFLRSLFFAFFLFYTLMGAPQVGRYIIFLVPVLALGAARGVRSAWGGPSSRARLAIALAAIAMAAIDVGELAIRRRTYSQRLLTLAMSAPANRGTRTDELLRELGTPIHMPVVLAEEPIQQRYEVDDRVVIRSLDGRTDRSLLAFVHDGKVDHLAYLKSEHVDLLASPVHYDRGSSPAALSGLGSLPEGSIVRRGALLFRRLPSGRFAIADAQSEHDGAGRRW